jgi:hypothetical protein
LIPLLSRLEAARAGLGAAQIDGRHPVRPRGLTRDETPARLVVETIPFRRKLVLRAERGQEKP